MHNISYRHNRYRPFVLLCCFLVASLIHINSFADSIYKLQTGDYLGKIVSKNYPSSQRINSNQQIMIAILRANPTAFRGGNVHFLKKVDQLILPPESTISLILKDEASKIVTEHYTFFKQRKTGDFALIPLQRPATEKENKVIEKKQETKKETVPVLTASTDKKTIIKSESSDIKTSADKKELRKKGEEAKKTEKAMSEDDFSYKSSSPHAENAIEKTKESKNIEKISKMQKEMQITLYSWDNFVPKDVLTSFMQETGIKVNFFAYKRNEVMYEKIKALNGRGYDILITTGQLVQKMRDRGLLQTIDHRKLKNFKHLNPKLLNKPYDPNNEFSIPYIWGSTGIGIDTDKLNNKSITHWKNLWHKQWRNKLLLHDNMRDLFAIALKINGYSINSRNPDEIKQAYNTLLKLIPNIKQLVSKLKLSDKFINDEEGIAMFWSPKASKVKRKHVAFQYIYPEEGAIFWVDNFIIPSNASDVESAHIFIDYLLRPDIAARCANELGEATPNLEAMKHVINQDTITFPDADVFEKGEFEESIGNTEVLYQLYWRKFKQEIEQNSPSAKN